MASLDAATPWRLFGHQATTVLTGESSWRVGWYPRGVLPGAPASFRVPGTRAPARILQCPGSHTLQGCSKQRCTPASGTPYGGQPSAPWAGPHSTLKAALTEWIKSGTFNGAASGRFTVDASGVAQPMAQQGAG